MAEAAGLNQKYNAAAPGWADKMRLLGYYDAYLGLLSSPNFRAPPGNRVLDIGCGTGAFAEAWVAIQGPEQDVTLLDPAEEMLTLAQAALQRRGVEPGRARMMLDQYDPPSRFHCLLAAHVLEHADDPVETLKHARRLAQPDGRLWLVVSKPHWCNAIIWFQWRHRAYRPADVHGMLAASGWELEMEYAFPSGPPSRTSRGYLARAA
ncbi:MAG: class I SAM-dependent methyltransferase [Paracoccaceae bacterium]